MFFITSFGLAIFAEEIDPGCDLDCNNLSYCKEEDGQKTCECVLGAKMNSEGECEGT